MPQMHCLQCIAPRQRDQWAVIKIKTERTIVEPSIRIDETDTDTETDTDADTHTYIYVYPYIHI